MGITREVLLRVAKWHEAHGNEKQRWHTREKNFHLRQSYQRDFLRHYKIARELKQKAYAL